jgi:hypothetical protein
MYGEYTFLTSCIDSTEKGINALVDDRMEISKEVFFYILADDKEIEVCGFSVEDAREMYGFEFYVSKYKGEKCYYMENSGIEYIFTKG